MTKAEIVSEIAISTGFDRASVSTILEAFMKDVKDNMALGKNVYLRGFGSFIVKTRKEKIARNILKRSSVYVPEHSVPDFKPAAEMKEAVYHVKLNKKAKK